MKYSRKEKCFLDVNQSSRCLPALCYLNYEEWELGIDLHMSSHSSYAIGTCLRGHPYANWVEPKEAFRFQTTFSHLLRHRKIKNYLTEWQTICQFIEKRKKINKYLRFRGSHIKRIREPIAYECRDETSLSIRLWRPELWQCWRLVCTLWPLSDRRLENRNA